MGPQRRSGRGFCTCIRTAACHQQQLSLPVVRVSIGDKDEILDLAGDVPESNMATASEFACIWEQVSV
jgi:hypothetical protein